MDKQTLKSSWNLVLGVAQMTRDHLFVEGMKKDKQDMVEAIDDAIQELNSWKKAVLNAKEVKE